MRHRRHERVGEDVGGDHREDDRHRQRPEEIAGDPAQREQRHEGDADAEQRDRRRRHDLLRAVGDGGQNILAKLLHMTVDVLDRDSRVVDQDADRERRPPSVITLMVWPSTDSAVNELSTASGIETVMIRVERQLPRKTRIIKPVSAAAIRPSRTTVVTEDLTKPDWSPTNVSVHARRKRRLDRRQARLDAGDDVERRRRADLENRHQHAFAAVELNDVGLRRRAVVDVGDVAHEDDRAVDHFDRKIVEVGEAFRQIVEVDGEFVGADFLGADRIDQVLQGERIADVDGRKTMGAQSVLVEIDLHLARAPPKGYGSWRAGDRGELRAG